MNEPNFGNFVRRFDAGEITNEVIEQLLEIVYPDDGPERSERRNRLIGGDGIIKFQAVGLNKQAESVYQQTRSAHLSPTPIQKLPDLPSEFDKDIPDEVYDHPDYVPQIKSMVGIVQAVRTWGKPQSQIKDNRTEGVKVRCPYSHHTDNKPSAWVNTQKNTWYCGKCQVGGDVIDFFAAAKHGLQPNDFHRSSQFATIVREMAEELGIQIVSTSDGGFVVEAETSTWASNMVDADPDDETSALIMEPVPTTVVEVTDEGAMSYEDFFEPSVPASAEALEPITITDDELLRGLELDDELDEDEFFDYQNLPSFEWRDLGVHEDTFLHAWMIQAEEELDWVPPEFFLGLGLQAIGIACGHDTTSMSFGLTLTGSTMSVIVGSTASGKSTATARLAGLLTTATGVKWDASMGTGVKKITSTASAEALTQRIRTDLTDPSDPSITTEVPTNAWYLEDELAQFISRSRRQGGEHIKQRVMRFHDFAKTKPEPELVAEDHSLTGGYRSVHDSYFTATFLTQNDALRDLAEKKDLVSGFFNRMIFFMGRSRAPRMFTKVVAHDPSPDYIRKYERMWKDCRNQRVIPFSDEAGLLIDSHPLNDRLNAIRDMSPMFSRWQIMMLRMSFLLAVNENSPLIEVRHVNAAYNLVSSYLIPCAASMVEYVKPEKSEKNIIVEQIVEWVGEYFDRKGEWPEARFIRATKWWRAADAEIRERSLDLAIKGSNIVVVSLLEGPWGTGQRTVAVIPEGDFIVFADSHNKKYKFHDFYDGRKNR